jgi:serine/threonine protein phosphatase 1
MMWPASMGNVIFANGFLQSMLAREPSSQRCDGTVHCPRSAAEGIVGDMRRSPRRRTRPRIRIELEAAAVPTWHPPRIATADAASLQFVLSPGRLPPGRRLYVIGDIHGCLAELRKLHAAIEGDLARRPVASALLLHLGDYIDFGPDSAGVLALLSAGCPIAGLPTINLMGDHERTALDALSGDSAAATDWLHTGGKATLASWGISPETPRSGWRSTIPPAQVAFMQKLVIEHSDGSYLFVHAGIRPGIPLGRQDEDDMLGIRQSFLASEQDFGVIVVHGHSATPAPSVRPNRIGIDTGAGNGGGLTCAVFEDDGVAFIVA